MSATRILPASSITSRSSIQNLCCFYSNQSSQFKPKHVFVPQYQDANDRDIKDLSELVNTSKKLLAITGNADKTNMLLL